MDELTQKVEAVLDLVTQYKGIIGNADVTEFYWNRIRIFLESCAALELPYKLEDVAWMVDAFDQVNTSGMFNNLLGDMRLAVAVEAVRSVVNAEKLRTSVTAAQARNLAK